jgi:resuscitation-promoting factor RpfB
MKQLALAILTIGLLTASCQPSSPINPEITIIDGETITTVDRTVNTSEALLISAGISYSPKDLILVDGLVMSPGVILPEEATTLQLRHAIPLTLINNGQQTDINSSAFTVGQALNEAGILLHEGDFLSPPAPTPILGPLTIEYRPAGTFSITSGLETIYGMSSADSVGEILAEAGISLQGLDYSLPGESDPVPDNGIIQVVRVNESVALVQKSIPFNTEVQMTTDLELDQQELLQVGEPGLAVTRTRIRYEDGQEVEQLSDQEAIVRPPKDRVIGAGTKIVLRTVDTPEGPLEYYRAVKVYATSYSPCRLGVPSCGSTTAGGLKAQRGVIGVIRSWWRYMNGEPVYVPGYGRAVISDIGAGISGRDWIDLAFSDDDYEPWHTWTTLYFLTPVPSSIMYVLD